MRTRIFHKSNYMATFNDEGLTTRFFIDDSKPVTPLEYPEFLDVSITGKCYPGNCKFCYQDSTEIGKHVDNAADLIHQIFSPLTLNQRPFQFAIGGGEPTCHPDLENILSTCRKLEIVPNYTTNGSWVESSDADHILEITKRYCGGVAVTVHPHLKHLWSQAIDIYLKNKIKLNLHVLVSDEDSISYLREIHSKYITLVDYIVLLKMVPQGRASTLTSNELDTFTPGLISFLKEVKREGLLTSYAFGAKLFPFIQDNPWIPISLYEAEMFSGYLDLARPYTIFKSSFDYTPKKTGLFK